MLAAYANGMVWRSRPYVHTVLHYMSIAANHFTQNVAFNLILWIQNCHVDSRQFSTLITDNLEILLIDIWHMSPWLNGKVLHAARFLLLPSREHMPQNWHDVLYYWCIWNPLLINTAQILFKSVKNSQYSPSSASVLSSPHHHNLYINLLWLRSTVSQLVRNKLITVAQKNVCYWNTL